ncbi:Rhodanese-like protein [Gonapodya prolifera JEL478]|uniref:Rhodanese-like protein n=1 Tax=Gonapodya prolifera (strain JEL478) TaxID=1344416 RepID=A0A139ACP7_GONPJ|nr:Rhodanese-like protein [Gonapodya prolifera JEL478]|eukprot:KXS14540.1 Rhodanese-like protein [Gonapodya prolifera JEL478]
MSQIPDYIGKAAISSLQRGVRTATNAPVISFFSQFDALDSSSSTASDTSREEFPSSDETPLLVSPWWLNDHLNSRSSGSESPSATRVIPIDCTHLPRPFLTEDSELYWRPGVKEGAYGGLFEFYANNWRDGIVGFEKANIPSSTFLPLHRLADFLSKHPLKLPLADDFASWCSDNGIRKQDHVVLYDQRGIGSAPRGAWMFKVFGHERVSILSGGLPAWTGSGLPTATGSSPRSSNSTESTISEPDLYECSLSRDLALDYNRMWDAAVNMFLEPEGWQIIDTRNQRL